jgi:hypothetical protein
MKTMTCKQLGGACEQTFTANTFEEIAKLSEQHGMEMFKANNEAHLEAMNKMRGMMQNPEDMVKWMDDKRADFEALAED